MSGGDRGSTARSDQPARAAPAGDSLSGWPRSGSSRSAPAYARPDRSRDPRAVRHHSTVVLPALELPTVAFPSFAVPALHAAPVIPDCSGATPARQLRRTRFVIRSSRRTAVRARPTRPRARRAPCNSPSSRATTPSSGDDERLDDDEGEGRSVCEGAGRRGQRQLRAGDARASPRPAAAADDAHRPPRLRAAARLARGRSRPPAVPVTQRRGVDPLAELRAKLAEQGITLADDGSIPLNAGSTESTTTTAPADTTQQQTTTPPDTSSGGTTTNTGGRAPAARRTAARTTAARRATPAAAPRRRRRTPARGSTTTPPAGHGHEHRRRNDDAPADPAPGATWITASVSQIEFGTVTEGTHATRPIEITNIRSEPITDRAGRRSSATPTARSPSPTGGPIDARAG